MLDGKEKQVLIDKVRLADEVSDIVTSNVKLSGYHKERLKVKIIMFLLEPYLMKYRR